MSAATRRCFACLAFSGKGNGAQGPGKQDVFFNNEKCVVVPAGVVDLIMQKIRPIAEYKREGNLYIAEMTMSGFARPDQAP